jgi:hypothetical protein
MKGLTQEQITRSNVNDLNASCVLGMVRQSTNRLLETFRSSVWNENFFVRGSKNAASFDKHLKEVEFPNRVRLLICC